MKMIYYEGLGSSFSIPKSIDLSKENVLSYEIKKLKGWKSPNLLIIFKDIIFEQPTGLIVNYDEVIKYLKKN